MDDRGGRTFPDDLNVNRSDQAWRGNAGREGTSYLTVVRGDGGTGDSGTGEAATRSLIDEIVREGAAALQAEGTACVEQFADRVDDYGHQPRAPAGGAQRLPRRTAAPHRRRRGRATGIRAFIRRCTRRDTAPGEPRLRFQQMPACWFRVIG